jgi:hypothetical protein
MTSPVMLSLETVPRLVAASSQFFQVLVLVLVLVVKALVLVLFLRVTVSVLAHTVVLTSQGFDNLTLVSFDNVKVLAPYCSTGLFVLTGYLLITM